MGVIAPNGIGLKAFWKSLLEGKSGIGPVTLFDASRFKSRIAGEVKNFDPTPAFPSPKDVRRADRYSQYGVFAGHQFRGPSAEKRAS